MLYQYPDWQLPAGNHHSTRHPGWLTGLGTATQTPEGIRALQNAKGLLVTPIGLFPVYS